MTTTDPRTAIHHPTPTDLAPAGPDSLSGHGSIDTQRPGAVEDQTSPQAKRTSTANPHPPAGTKASRSQGAPDIHLEVAAADSPLNGQQLNDTQVVVAVEGQDSPQATATPAPIGSSPAGTKTSRSQYCYDTHATIAAADNFPGGQPPSDAQHTPVAGDQVLVPAISLTTTIGVSPVRDQAPSAATAEAAPISHSLLADPLLALAADVLDDLEKVRLANENRLRQLTRSVEDSDGETRGFGLDETNPDVARLAALVGMLGEADHKATLNLQRIMRNHLLGPWMAAQKGIGEKQGARLLAAIGDPYIRPEVTREDDVVEPPRPRTVSELWAYCGLKPGQKRRRGEKSNWSAAAKMRAWNIAGSMLKAGNREVYDKRKAATQGRIHAEDCVRCGPSGKPAPAGTPWSDAHRHADALRIVSKAILRDLWREAKRIHEEASAGGHKPTDIHGGNAASGDKFPPPMHGSTSKVFAAAEPT